MGWERRRFLAAVGGASIGGAPAWPRTVEALASALWVLKAQ